MRVSIIIAAKEENEYLKKCVDRCLDLRYDSYEIIVLPDHEVRLQNVRLVPTGPVSPGEKRNTGMKMAEGEFLAFIDDDAYPDSDWLKNAERHFDREDVAAVGGPNLTAQSNDVYQQASGFILSSYIGTGTFSFEFKDEPELHPRTVMDVEDQSSCNLIVRKSVMEEIAGFDVKYWPGEDSIFCWKIRKTGKKIVYASDVIVYHHRRPLFRKFWRQISAYGFHRGLFIRRIPELPLRLSYFIPSLFLLFVVSGFLMQLFNYSFRSFYLLVLAFYLITILLVSVRAFIRTKNSKLAALVFAGIILAHVSYGTHFLRGLLEAGSGASHS